jgi:signal transduction histidine kinase
MTEIIIIALSLLCIGQLIYIFQTKKQLKNWLDILNGIKRGEKEKIYIKNKGLIADISYQLNGVMEDKQAQIILLTKSDEANKQILTSLSHDVRTPLASLLGYLEALNKGLSDGREEKEYISVAYRKANDLKAFIDMLFEWFKLNSNEQQYLFEATDINETTREILIEWLPVFEQSQIVLSANINDDDLMVSIDKTAYKRIINNLVQNAIKHGDSTRITITVKSCSEKAIIEVANNGQAIPAGQLPHIFERLYKGDKARSDKGSGLGLTISKELVTALHGEISVSSAPGTDTIFSISFPILK